MTKMLLGQQRTSWAGQVMDNMTFAGLRGRRRGFGGKVMHSIPLRVLTWNITDGVPLATETGNENFILRARQAATKRVRDAHIGNQQGQSRKRKEAW